MTRSFKIELSGADAGQNVDGLNISAANSTVKGLVINRWDRYGVLISGPPAPFGSVLNPW